MIINEIFYSLQGEGFYAGFPSVFIRLAGCPLRCRWCDTSYAWPDSAGQKYSADQLRQEIKSHPSRYVVITGGEPMTNAGLPEFLQSFAEDDTHITIETSGIAFVADLPCDLMSISPKLSNSTPTEAAPAARHDQMRFDLSALQRLIDSYEYQLKFVVDSPQDIDEIFECLEGLSGVNRDKVFLMPQAATADELIEKSRMTALLCKKTGFALSARLQVLLWNNKRGR